MEFLEKTFYNNTVLEWLLSLSIIIGSIFVSKVLYKLINKYAKKFADKTENNYDDIIVDKVEEPLTALIIIVGYMFAIGYLHMSEGFDKIAFALGKLSLVITFTWMLTRTLSGLADEFIKQLIEKSDNEFYEQILPLLKKCINVEKTNYFSIFA